jgi:predicted kinase
MAKFIMVMGLPYSGKTTWAKEYCERTGAKLVSAEEIAHELYGDAPLINTVKIHRIMEQNSIHYLQQGYDVVYDSLNLNAKKRAGVLKQLKLCLGYHFTAECVLTLCPIEECIKRERKKKKAADYSKVRSSLLEFQSPYFNEGWNDITIEGLDNISDEEVMATQISLYKRTVDYDQSNSHHRFTLDDHLNVAAVACDHPIYPSTLYWAARWHDIGKPDSRVFDDKGEAHYYGHEYISAYHWLCSAMAVRSFKKSKEHPRYYMSLRVAALICWHMIPYHNMEWSDTVKWLENRGFDQQFIELLNYLHKADKFAH